MCYGITSDKAVQDSSMSLDKRITTHERKPSPPSVTVSCVDMLLLVRTVHSFFLSRAEEGGCSGFTGGAGGEHS